jgi:small conductance mechanosensitive channel
MDMTTVWTFVTTQGLDFGLKVLGALAAWFVGRWLIGLLRRVAQAAMRRGQHIDQTLAAYLGSILAVGLNILLFLAILDIFGVKTTSFAALLAGAGLAIGTAWGGLLTHFAAGVFLQVLRPYKVGDHVIIGGVNGKVTELGLFGTTVITADNVQALVGNNKVLGDTIQNFSALPTRRVDLNCSVPVEMDIGAAITKLQQEVARIANVAREPAPRVDILRVTPRGVQLAVRPSANPAHFDQVQQDTHRMMMEVLGHSCVAPDDADKPAP